MSECGAKTRAGGTCKQAAMPNGRCYFHGGKSLAGIASPRLSDGTYSKYVLPPRLRKRYDAALNDPALLEQRREIALIDARLGDLLARVDTGESGALWSALMERREELIDAKRGGDTIKQVLALNAILDLISQGHADYRAWRELGAALDQRRKLVESERKRLVEMQQVMTSEQAMLLMDALLMAVKANVQDRGALNAIQTEFIRLTTHDTIDVSTDE
jgi:hypothetical protein